MADQTPHDAILAALRAGRPERSIASEMGVSRGTVATHKVALRILNGDMPPNVKRVQDTLTSNPDMTNPELCERLGLSMGSIRKAVTQLRIANIELPNRNHHGGKAERGRIDGIVERNNAIFERVSEAKTLTRTMVGKEFGVSRSVVELVVKQVAAERGVPVPAPRYPVELLARWEESRRRRDQAARQRKIDAERVAANIASPFAPGYSNDPLVAQVLAAIPAGLDPHIRADVAQDMVLDILEGNVTLEEVGRAYRRYLGPYRSSEYTDTGLNFEDGSEKPFTDGTDEEARMVAYLDGEVDELVD